MDIRLAVVGDADGMSRVLREIIALTGRERPSDMPFVTAHYITNPDSIRCSVAVDDSGDIMGFQSLVRAVSGNRYAVPAGWGIIGTHISPRAHRQGVGKALFRASVRAATEAGLDKIDACIGAGNTAGLHYYESRGFQTYREPEGIIQKMFVVSPDEE